MTDHIPVNMTVMKNLEIEHKNKCDLCKKKEKSRIYYKLINNKWVYLCPKCWDTAEAIEEGAI